MAGALVQVLLADLGEDGAFLLPYDVIVHADSGCPNYFFETGYSGYSCSNRYKKLTGCSGKNAVAADLATDNYNLVPGLVRGHTAAGCTEGSMVVAVAET